MKIKEIKENKKQFLPLLLLADEQEDMINRYLDKGTMYVLDDDGVKCECVITDEGNGVLEIKNIATEMCIRDRVWAYIQPSSFAYLVQKKYKEMEKLCTEDNVHSQLNCAIAQNVDKAKRIKDLIICFGDEKTVREIRSINNSIKHRGMMYFKGFSKEDISKFLFDPNIEMPLKRETYDPNYIQELLLSYHEKFEEYFNDLIALIMPIDYKNNDVGIINYISILDEIKKIQLE